MLRATFFQIGLALALYPVVRLAVIGYARLPDGLHHDPGDMAGARLEASKKRLDRWIGTRWLLPLAWTIAALATLPAFGWRSVDPTGTVRVLSGALATMIAWKCATLGVDLSVGRTQPFERLGILACAAGAWFAPALLAPLLYLAINELRGWRHHQHAPIRVLIAVIATWVACLFVRSTTMTVAALFMALSVTATHYFVPGLAKLKLGPWVRANRLHYFAISSYLWGWARPLGDERAVRIARALRVFDRPNQLFTVLFELAAGFVLFHESIAWFFLASALAFHVVSVVLAGILFWQNSVLVVLLGGVLVSLPEPWRGQLFGLYPGLAGLAVNLLAYKKVLWRPKPLAWWDTPLALSIHWIVEGRSGTRYWLGNNFMQPHDRIFGNKLPHVLSRRPRLSYNAGTTPRRAQLEAILKAGADRASLDAAAAEHGRVLGSDALDAEHDAFLVAFFVAFNRGVRKHVCPAWLRAPAAYFRRWTIPSFCGEEPIARIHLIEREEVFDGERVVFLGETALRRIEIPAD